MQYLEQKRVVPLPQRTPRRNNTVSSPSTLLCVPCDKSPPTIHFLRAIRVPTSSTSQQPLHCIAACLATNESDSQRTTSYTFTECVNQRPDLIVPFFRALHTQAPTNYHLCVVPIARLDMWYSSCRWGVEFSKEEVRTMLETAQGATVGKFVVFIFGHDIQENQKAPSFNHDAKDLVFFTDRAGKIIRPGVTFGEICIGKTQHISTSLDAQGRCMYICVMQHSSTVATMGDLEDEALYDLWRSAVASAEDSSNEDCECCAPGLDPSLSYDPFVDMRLNAGSFQNIGHLHLKVTIPSSIFFERWKASDSWRKLIVSSMEHRTVAALKKHVEQEELRMAKRNDDDKYWTYDAPLRCALGVEACPLKTDDVTHVHMYDVLHGT